MLGMNIFITIVSKTLVGYVIYFFYIYFIVTFHYIYMFIMSVFIKFFYCQFVI